MKDIRKAFTKYVTLWLIGLSLGIIVPGLTDTVHAEPQTKTTKTTQKKTTTTRKRKTNTSTGKAETSADVKKREQATQKEIKETEEKIRQNEQSVKQGLAELGKLQGDISESQAKINKLSKTIADLDSRINVLETGIGENEKDLKMLRDEYLKAVKKMRVAKKNKSDLVFLFSSENFNQALRRMRYLKQFSEWQQRQSSAIEEKVEELKTQKGELAIAKEKQDDQLKAQRHTQSQLESQYKKQDELVAGLKKNGSVLQAHLSKKQQEANELRNRISALIAEEQRKAAEEKAKKEAEERAKAEAARKAEEERLLAEANAQKESNKTEEKKTERKRKSKTEDKKEDKNKNNNPTEYADARKRTPRGTESPASSTSTSTTVSTSNSGVSFASMKGSLPHPASGSFKVTSRFGQQTLPDLPDIVYDNPGIDAEVSEGASALAVYNGNVSGVYMVPGYNTVVIVNHGTYYTVYGNISSPSVKVGDEVKVGQGLGKLAPDEDNHGRSSIHFEVWRNREKLNPLEWIKN